MGDDEVDSVLIMNILAIECSTSHASLCVMGDNTYFYSWEAARNHDEHLFPALRAALAQGAPDVVLVGSGPGSYGGVRVALAAATGIAVVSGATVVALCSWEHMAEGKVCILSDAKRGGWTLRYPSGEIKVLNTEQIKQLQREGTEIWSVESEALLARAGIVVPRSGLVPTAEGLVTTWLSLSEQEQARRAALPAEPIYVRPPHITTPKHKPWEIPNA